MVSNILRARPESKYNDMTDIELALRTALNVLRDSVESRRMPSGKLLDLHARSVHERAIGELDNLLREVAYDDSLP